MSHPPFAADLVDSYDIAMLELARLRQSSGGSNLLSAVVALDIPMRRFVVLFSNKDNQSQCLALHGPILGSVAICLKRSVRPGGARRLPPCLFRTAGAPANRDPHRHSCLWAKLPRSARCCGEHPTLAPGSVEDLGVWCQHRRQQVNNDRATLFACILWSQALVRLV